MSMHDVQARLRSASCRVLRHIRDGADDEGSPLQGLDVLEASIEQIQVLCRTRTSVISKRA